MQELIDELRHWEMALEKYSSTYSGVQLTPIDAGNLLGIITEARYAIEQLRGEPHNE